MTRLAPRGECDPEKPTYVHCDGMHAVFALPCSRLTSHWLYSPDPEVAVDWKTAVLLAYALVDQVVPLDARGYRCAYEIRIYAQFKWKTKKQSHFAQYTYWMHPLEPSEKRCVHLFTSAFKWTKPTFTYPDPYNIYRKFQGIKLRQDGTPDVTFWLKEWHWLSPPDPRLYTREEWTTILQWQRAMWYYDHELKICTAKYDYLGEWVIETKSERAGIVVDIRPPKQYSQVWETVDGKDIMGPNKKQWMKSQPLEFIVRMADGTKFETTRRSLTYTEPRVEITYDRY